MCLCMLLLKTLIWCQMFCQWGHDGKIWGKRVNVRSLREIQQTVFLALKTSKERCRTFESLASLVTRDPINIWDSFHEASPMLSFFFRFWGTTKGHIVWTRHGSVAFHVYEGLILFDHEVKHLLESMLASVIQALASDNGTIPSLRKIIGME